MKRYTVTLSDKSTMVIEAESIEMSAPQFPDRFFYFLTNREHVGMVAAGVVVSMTIAPIGDGTQTAVQ